MIDGMRLRIDFIGSLASVTMMTSDRIWSWLFLPGELREEFDRALPMSSADKEQLEADIVAGLN